MKIQAAARIQASDFEATLKQRDAIDLEVKKLSDKLNSYPKSSMGLTSDEVKRSPEWQKLRAEYDRTFKSLQNINSKLTGQFKKEYTAWRAANRRR